MNLTGTNCILLDRLEFGYVFWLNECMNKTIKVLLIVGLGLSFAGCNITENVNIKEYEMQGGSIDKSLRGKLGPANESGEYTLSTSEGPKMLHDGKASLAGYEGQNLQVTGQYSGTTLYVDQLQIISGEMTGLTPTPFVEETQP
jgi:hypothetical protein